MADPGDPKTDFDHAARTHEQSKNTRTRRLLEKFPGHLTDVASRTALLTAIRFTPSRAAPEPIPSRSRAAPARPYLAGVAATAHSRRVSLQILLKILPVPSGCPYPPESAQKESQYTTEMILILSNLLPKNEDALHKALTFV